MKAELHKKKASWQASWIWGDIPPNTPNVYLEARKSFDLEKPASRARLFVSANQKYQVYLNGSFAGGGPSPADLQWKYYDEIDVTGLIRSGRNALAIVAYNFGTSDIVTGQMQGPGGLIAELEIEMGDGTLAVIATDSDWKVRRSPRWMAQVSRQHLWNGFREIYLAEKEDGWEEPDYDDASWAGASVVAAALDPDSPWPRLLPREIPPLERVLAKPAAIVRTDSNFGVSAGECRMLAEAAQASAGAGGSGWDSWTLDASAPGSLPGVVFDFGKETVGYPELEVHAPEGGVIQLSYGESLELQLYDTFILRPGMNRLKPFGRRAFRFLQVSCQATPVPLKVAHFAVESVHYPFDRSGYFRSSDERLNRIWEVGVYTTLVNSQDHLEDCPLREEALWVADAVVMGKVIYHAFGDERLLRKCLLQGARIQNPDGSIPGTGPERNSFLLPDFCAHWLFGVHAHWLYTKDRGFLGEIWPAVERLMAWFLDQEDSSGLFARADRPGWWCFIDWADYIDRRDRVTAVSCFYYKALGLAADLAAEMDLHDLARQWREHAARLRTAIRGQMRKPGDIVFADCIGPEGLSAQITAQTNFAAVWSGVMDPKEADRFLDEWYEAGKLPPLKGAFFYHVVLETLIGKGRTRRALDLIREYWGGMLDRGATTWWETFDPALPFSTVPSPYQGHTPTYLIDHIPVSFSHGWGASPSYILTRYVLGLDLRRLGDREVRIEFDPGDLSEAEGAVPTRYGLIEARWNRKEGGGLRYELTIPQCLTVKAEQGTELVVSTREGMIV
ncbi:family 78 glycoside hydrolase catalytic domain [Paenibacillus lactis]|uniref:Alpha-L-rhamnosidase n=1 Tax=Paenibacillus lactis 154 TaxID=743719 RepID=G4HNB6_9BACL|nr:family 78 glycoside hydrolase catalytic domain [Paenibacillus lactis]EHB50647.1 alpha-L-rhamnosidase [Paenibacillus lactis 154]